MFVGASKTDITPPLEIPYLSFHPRQTAFEGVHDPLYVRTTVFDNGHNSVALISADALGFSRSVLGSGRDFIQEIREQVQSRTGIPAGNILVSATHAHSTPQTTDLADLVGTFTQALPWLEKLIDTVAASAEDAWNNRRQVRIRCATGISAGIGWCRRIITTDGSIVRLPYRPPDEQIAKEPRDDSLLLLSIEGDGWRSLVLNFACHPVTVQVQPLISADYPGVACARLEQEIGAEACLFFQAAAGDINPVRHASNFDDVEIYGQALADSALETFRNTAMEPMSDTIETVREKILVPRRHLPYREKVAQNFRKAQEQLNAANSEEDKQRLLAPYRSAAEKLRFIELGEGSVECEVQILRLGEALIVAVEGELFVEYGHRIREASPAPFTLIASCSNGYRGYIVTPETFDEGGYEASLGAWSRMDPGAGDIIVARTIEMMNDVWK